ncbi:hypothetical protein L1887_59112 [Cichorium endivia]|nr:hypothetical protein L1887_59112 [Cichorium endivia]
MVEDDERPDHRRDNRANTVESLREVDTNLRVLWRTADGDVWVRSGFEATKAITDDENGRTEASERAVEDTWPCDKRADAVQAQSPDESCFVAVMAQNPVGVAERSQRIRAEVGCLQTRRACTGDVQDVLKMFRELSSLSPLVIAALQRMLLQPARRHRCGSGNGTGGLRERRDRCEELSPYYLSASMELLRQLRLSDMLRPRTHGYHLACSMVTNDLLPCLGPVPSLLRPAAMLHCRRFPPHALSTTSRQSP